jgi:GT2 family glycosyltransferase
MGYRTLYYSGSEIIHLGGVSTTMQQKIRPTELEKRLERYAALINETMGYTKGIRASEIAIFSAKIKRLISSNKDYFTSAINYERKVVEYLQAKRHEEKNPN